MVISEVIKKLQEIKDEYGDIHIKVIVQSEKFTTGGVMTNKYFV